MHTQINLLPVIDTQQPEKGGLIQLAYCSGGQVAKLQVLYGGPDQAFAAMAYGSHHFTYLVKLTFGERDP